MKRISDFVVVGVKDAYELPEGAREVSVQIETISSSVRGVIGYGKVVTYSMPAPVKEEEPEEPEEEEDAEPKKGNKRR